MFMNFHDLFSMYFRLDLFIDLWWTIYPKCFQKQMPGDPFGAFFVTFSEGWFFYSFWSPFGSPWAHFWLDLVRFWVPLPPFWFPLALFWFPFGSIFHRFLEDVSMIFTSFVRLIFSCLLECFCFQLFSLTNFLLFRRTLPDPYSTAWI